MIPLHYVRTLSVDSRTPQSYAGRGDGLGLLVRKGPTGSRTQVGGFKVHSDNHYTIRPLHVKRSAAPNTVEAFPACIRRSREPA